MDKVRKEWMELFFDSASDVVRLAEVPGTPFNESDQASHIAIAVGLMELCEKLDSVEPKAKRELPKKMRPFLQQLVKQLTEDLNYVAPKSIEEVDDGHPMGDAASHWYEIRKLLRRAYQ
jgi:hypothetical protein